MCKLESKVCHNLSTLPNITTVNNLSYILTDLLHAYDNIKNIYLMDSCKIYFFCVCTCGST